MRHLTLADEIVVLMLDDDTGAIKPACANFSNIAIAGGILMELALLGRIDTDLKSLFVVDPKPVDDDLLDPVLVEVAADPRTQPSTWWIERIGMQRRDLTKVVLDRLVEAGILCVNERRFLWVFSRRAYPQNTGREEREAKARLAAILLDHTVPDPRDTLLLGLADASGVLGAMLTAEQMRRASGRIAQVVALEEIGRAVKAVEANLLSALAALAAARSM
jgi:golgi phosphoprotein 3